MAEKLVPDLKRSMLATSSQLATIKSHLSAIENKEGGDKEDLSLLFGRLSYQVSKLKGDIESQGKQFAQTASKTGFKLKDASSTAKDTAQSEKRSSSLRLVDSLSSKRFNSAKDLMSASRGFLEKHSKPVKLDSIDTQQRKTMVEFQDKDSLRRSFYFQKNYMVPPGKIAQADVLPRFIRKNPFSDLPPISENDLQKGLFHLVNLGLIPKDLDLLPAFNQGAPILETSQKKFAELPKRNFLIKPLDHDTIHKFKLENSSILQNSSSMLKQSSLLQNSTKAESNFFLTDLSTTKNQSLNQTHFQQAAKQKIPQKFKTTEYILKDKVEEKDIHSGKNYLITILGGHIEKDNQDYQEMKKIHSYIWGSIKGLLKRLENLAREHKINTMNINGEKLLGLVNDLVRVKDQQLVSCVENKELIIRLIPGEKQASFKGKAWAALKILCSFKMRRAMKELQKRQAQQSDSMEKRWRVAFWMRYLLTQRQLKKLQVSKLSSYASLQKSFEQNFTSIVKSKRVEVHINSISLDAEVVIVVPFELPLEVVSYYHKICELGELKNFKDRLHFIYPENTKRFPSHFCISKLLYYSPKALKQLKGIIQNKNGYIVPGIPSQEDSLLGMILNLPVLSGPWKEVCKLNKKSHAKQLFDQCSLPIAPGAEDITTEEQFVNKLTILIAKHPSVTKWLFKIDGEIRGRGIAFFSIESVRAIADVRKQAGGILEANHVTSLREIISSLLPSKTVIATPSLYSTYPEFLNSFLFNHGIIEACPSADIQSISSPSIFFLLQPDGECQVLGSYDKVSGTEYVNFACLFPQTSLPQLNLKQICSSLTVPLRKRGIFGYITLDLLAFPDQSDTFAHPLFWAIGIDCYLTDYSASSFAFDFLSKGHFDRTTNKYFLGTGELPEKILPDDFGSIKPDHTNESNLFDEFEERSFMFIPYLFHPGLNSIPYREFFQLCRKNQISFDIEKKIGSVFFLIDGQQHGVLSLMTIGQNIKAYVKLMADTLNFVLQIAGVVQRKVHKNPLKRTDSLYLMDLIYQVRSLNKEKDQQFQITGSPQTQ